MTKEKTEDFLKEMTTLCYKHNLWIDGDNLKIIDSDLVQVAKNFDWDYDTQSLVADFDDNGSRF